MRQTIKSLLLVAVLTAVVAAAPAAFARDNAAKGRPQHKERRAFDDSQIPPEKREELKALREQFRTQGKVLREALKVKREALMKELEKEEFNRAAADTLAEEVKDLQGKLVDQRIEGILAMREIVGSEKIKDFKGGRRHHEGKYRDRREKGGQEKAQ